MSTGAVGFRLAPRLNAGGRLDDATRSVALLTTEDGEVAERLALALDEENRARQAIEREMLDVTAFEHPHDYATHFKDRYGPTIAAQKNARANGQEAELEQALDAFTDEWNIGSADDARFEQEYLVVVGTRA